jgi:hypothetical protein
MAASGGTTLAVAAGVVARSAYAGACSTTSSGVTVVVDFSAFGQGVQVSCVPGNPGTGLAALQSIYSVTGTAKYGYQFVCRINNRPGPDQEPCQFTPPANAYWSYWHAERGGSWRYSSASASTFQPKPGSVEGWAFGAGSPPGIAPPAAPPPPPPPPPPPAGGGSGTGATTRPPSGGPGQAAPTAAHPGTVPGVVTSGIPAGESSATADPSASSGTDVGATGANGTGRDANGEGRATNAEPSTGAGGPVGTLVGIGLVVLLAAVGAGTAVWRRRQHSATRIEE